MPVVPPTVPDLLASNGPAWTSSRRSIAQACQLSFPFPTLPPPLPRVFLEERILKDGAFSDSLEADAAELKTLMGLGNKEAAEIEADVKQAAYK